jgi:hypothetical protein
MADHVSIGDLVNTATVLGTLDDNPPPMDFHTDLGVPKTSLPQTDNGMSADFSFMKGPS